MGDILTTGGVFRDADRKQVVANICSVFGCEETDIENLVPVQSGLSNVVLVFDLNGGKYIYRHPGLGSDELVNRGRETFMQAIASETGIDGTLIAIDVAEGWRIGKFVEHRPFDYHDLNDMVRAMLLFRRLHSAPCKARWNFDVIKKSEQIKLSIPDKDYGNFDRFYEIKERIYKLNELTKLDGIRKCFIHGDARDDNFLINDDEIYLIDWEYAGYGDPGFDLGSYICGGEHTREEVDRSLYTYFGGKPDLKQRRHFYAYIAITGYFYLHWTMLKESKGQMVGFLKNQWYKNALEYSEMALKLYEENDKK